MRVDEMLGQQAEGEAEKATMRTEMAIHKEPIVALG